MEIGKLNWICVQLGAREHYAIPRALQSSGRLEVLFTEIWAGSWMRRLAVGPLRALAGRYHPDLEKAESGKQKAKIFSWNWQTVARQLRAKVENGRWKAQNTSPQPSPQRGEGRGFEQFIRDGRWFSERVRDYLARQKTEVRGKVVFSYDTTALELFRWAKARGAICVLGQMDPGRVEVEMVQKEEQRWPGWTRNPIRVPEEYFQRRAEEWRLADCIVVNSQWSAAALMKQEVPPEKLVVIPLAFETNAEMRKPAASCQKSEVRPPVSGLRPLKVLFLGQVNVRKGIQYLVEAAKLLANEPVQFDVVGAIGISVAAIKLAPPNVTFHGCVGRDEAAAWYARSDVFVLPTISDGFALTQIEAMAHGLPVIATPNCGAVVTDGLDGFVVPPRDAMALAQALRRYLEVPELLPEQRAAALEKSRVFSLDRLAGHLTNLEQSLKHD